MNNNDAPEGYMKDAKGRLVPNELVAPIDKLRDQTVLTIVEKALALSRDLSAFKLLAFADIAAFIETSIEQYDAPIRGTKGNVTLRTFDGRFKVVRSFQDNIRFDERLVAAKALIEECLADWSEGARAELMVFVNDAFEVDKQGNVRVSRVLGLRRHSITDPRWTRAMKAISDSVIVVDSTSYVRVYERVGETDRYVQITLDLASA